jgi:4'-phosphopantetheinyl transferase
MSREQENAAPETGFIALWCAYPGDLEDERISQECVALLGENERARAARFRFAQNTRTYLATHALARIALSHHHPPVSPQTWRFPTNSYGKPAAEPECGLRFNLSNSDGLVVCLIACGADVGVDVEARTRAEEIAALAPKIFSESEQEQLESLYGADRLDRALSLWTLKEAYTKARGIGLSLPLKRFSFVFSGAGEIRLQAEPDLDDHPEHWRFCLLDHAGHRIAVMMEGKSTRELEAWEARPLLRSQVRLREITKAEWF